MLYCITRLLCKLKCTTGLAQLQGCSIENCLLISQLCTLGWQIETAAGKWQLATATFERH